MNGTMYTIGEMLRRARHERNLTLEKLSRSARVPPSTIWKYENEHVDYSFFTVLKLATALQKNVGYFLGEGDSGREDVLLAGPETGSPARFSTNTGALTCSTGGWWAAGWSTACCTSLPAPR